MLWEFVDPTLAEFELQMPSLSDVAVVLAPVSDYRDTLLGVEQQALDEMSLSRQHAYSSGRHCAHRSQELLSLDVQPIGRTGRVPSWPAMCHGSITHSRALAAAVVATGGIGVGIDLEAVGRVKPRLYDALFTQYEQSTLNSYEFDAATICFSAKEAGYKAIFPSTRKFIGFQEAEVYLQPEMRRFTLGYLGPDEESQRLEDGWGCWSVHAGHVLTLFFLPK